DPDRRHLRAHRRNALPQPGAHRQTEAGCACGRNRTDARRGESLGESCSERARGKSARADSGGGERRAAGADRTFAQTCARKRGLLPCRLYDRRSIAVGCRRAASENAAPPAQGLGFFNSGPSKVRSPPSPGRFVGKTSKLREKIVT